MKIINVQNQSQEWLDWRRSGIGGSDIAAICGVCPFRNRADVLKDKLGLSENIPNAAMRRGTHFEAEARAAFEKKQNDTFPPIMVQDEVFDFFLASLDGFSEATGDGCEIKVPGQRTIDLAACGVIPENYKYQMQWALGITGKYYMWYVVYDAATKELYAIQYWSDQKLQERLREEAKRFWGEVMIAREAPIVSDEKIVYCNPQFQKCFELKEQIRKLEREYDEIIAEVHEEHGKNHTLYSQMYVLQRSEREGFDYRQAAIDAFLPLSKYVKPKTICWTLRKKKAPPENQVVISSIRIG